MNLGNQVMRRSLNSNLVAQQVDRLVIWAVLGHTSEQMTARYHHASATDKAAAVAKVTVRRRPDDDAVG